MFRFERKHWAVFSFVFEYLKCLRRICAEINFLSYKAVKIADIYRQINEIERKIIINKGMVEKRVKTDVHDEERTGRLTYF